MQTRPFGRTGVDMSVIGLGCGAVGGLMVRGDRADQERVVARALEAGVNYFDTAAQYGLGASETNLGRVLAASRPDVLVGTKVLLTEAALGDIAGWTARSLEGSLQRLGMERVDLFHLHNPIGSGGGEALSARIVLDQVVPALEKLREQGKARLIGITAVGNTGPLLDLVDAGAFQSAQVVYNMLNPSAGETLPGGYPAQDYGRLLDHATASGVGTIGIRVLAGGALSGTAERHPTASPPPDPIGSAFSYDADLRRARRLGTLVAEGFADSLPEAATRFAISHAGLGTVLIGVANLDQFEQALAAAAKGPLPAEALARLSALQEGFVGGAR